jgi:hypothetical protein
MHGTDLHALSRLARAAADLGQYHVACFIENDTPKLDAVAAWQTVTSAQLAIDDIAAQFRRSRDSMLDQLRSLRPVDWLRVGQHAGFGPATLQQPCSYFAKHERWHIAQIARIRSALIAI